MPTHIRLVPFVFFCAALSPAAAQVPPEAGSILRESETIRPPAEPRQDAVPLPAPPAAAPRADDEEERLFVPAFRLTHAEPLAAEAQALLDAHAGGHLSMAEIDAAVGQVTALFRARGYPLANAWLPPQDVGRDGVLTVDVSIGRYGEVVLTNESPVGEARVRALYRGLRAGEAIHRADLERAFLLTADLAGVALPRLTVRPGQAEGSADLLLTVPAGKRWGGFAVYDNQGSRYTGRHRLALGAEVNAPLGLGDKLSVNGVYGHGSARKLTSARLAYAVPVADGLRLDVAADRTTYELGDQYEPLEATGHADSVEAGARYPLVRGQDRNVEVGARFSARRLRDDIDAVAQTTKKRIRGGEVTVHIDQWGTLGGRGTRAALDLAYVRGQLDFDDAAQRAANRRGANTQGDFQRLTLKGTFNYAISPRWSLNAAVSAQRALGGKSLDGSEQMTITGPGGARAYRESISGDHGYFANIEARCTLPPVAGVAHALGIFVGHGKVWFARPAYAVDNGIQVADAGIGYYAGKGPVSVRAQLAHKIGAQPDARVAKRDGDTHFLVQIGLSF
ncbi:MAG: hypothetical protein LBB76_08275 [Azoarcus sp.]|jgi:hemolysin activation/secretion protein|nr:hypothetical protein [Azoarcus sp.]